MGIERIENKYRDRVPCFSLEGGLQPLETTTFLRELDDIIYDGCYTIVIQPNRFESMLRGSFNKFCKMQLRCLKSGGSMLIVNPSSAFERALKTEDVHFPIIETKEELISTIKMLRPQSTS